jgi:hypothetical protein
MSKILKIQSIMIELHEKSLRETDEAHLTEGAKAEYTVFETGSYVLLEPAAGKPKNRLHSRRLGPFLVLGHTDNTYSLQNLISKKEFKVNIHRMYPFHFDPDRVNPQDVAAHDDEEFLVESVLAHRGNLSKKTTLEFQIRWLGYSPSDDTWEPWKNVMHLDKLHDYLRSIGQEKLIPK